MLVKKYFSLFLLVKNSRENPEVLAQLAKCRNC